MNIQTPAPAREHLNHPRTLAAFHTVRMLVGAYLAISMGTVVTAFLLRGHPDRVTPAVWTRGVIVAATSVLLYMFAARASRGDAGAYRRLRIISAILVAVIVVLIAIPGGFPVWMKIEQGVCGVLLGGVVLIVNGPHLRSLFAAAQISKRSKCSKRRSAMRVQDAREDRSLPVAAVTVMPYALVAILTVVTMILRRGGGRSLLIDLGLCGLLALWMAWMFTLRPTWRSRRRAMELFVAGVVVLTGILVVRDPWFGFFAPAGYVYAFRLLPWPGRLPGVGAVAVVAGVALSGTLEIESEPGTGTAVSAAVPSAHEEAPA